MESENMKSTPPIILDPSSSASDSNNTTKVETQVVDSAQKIAADATTESAAHNTEADSTDIEKPPVCIVLGMAGSGKTSVMTRVAAHMSTHGYPSYHINLDPAVSQVPFPANIDICDTVNYREVMKQYGLGPNGSIMTSLNLFATRFEEVMQLLEKRGPELDYVFVDTPGQIEVFTWSASGDIITKMLATSFPTVLIYVVDTTRCTSATTFIHEFAVEWMKDYDAFVEALQNERDDSYMSTLVRSMGLSLQEFYETLESVGVSAATGIGMPMLFEAIDRAAQTYKDEYIPALEAQQAAARQTRAKQNPNREVHEQQFKSDVAQDQSNNLGKKNESNCHKVNTTENNSTLMDGASKAL